jgi:acetyl esterase/lipase
MLKAGSAGHAEPASLDDYMKQPRHEADATIHYGSAPSQLVELFLPKGGGLHPVVVLLHGGCFHRRAARDVRRSRGRAC